LVTSATQNKMPYPAIGRCFPSSFRQSYAVDDDESHPSSFAQGRL